MFNLLRGLAWPIAVTNQFNTVKQESVPQLTQEQFDNSRFATMYTCWAIALRTNRAGDSDVLSRTITWANKADSTTDALHQRYMHLAGVQLQRIEVQRGFESYYQAACAAPVARMQQAIQQGMVK